MQNTQIKALKRLQFKYYFVPLHSVGNSWIGRRKDKLYPKGCLSKYKIPGEYYFQIPFQLPWFLCLNILEWQD